MADTEALQSSTVAQPLHNTEGASVGVPVPGIDGASDSAAGAYSLRGTIAEARDLFRTNHEFFILTCYPDLTLRVPQFHCELLEAMTDKAIQYLVCVCPRGFAKTMIVRATAAYALMTGESPFVTVINRNIKDAANSTREIWRIMQTRVFQDVYGRIEPVVERDGLGEYEYMQNGQYKVLFARGRDSALQGMNVHNMRPNLIICDDIEQAKDKNEDLRYEDTKSWFFETMLFLMDEQNRRCIYIGNMNKKQSLIAELPTLSDWHSIVLSAIKSDGTALWEDRFPKAKLLAEFKQYCEIGMRREWLAQKMSRVEDDSNALITADEIDIVPDRGWVLCDMVHTVGMDPTALLTRAINLALHWRISLVCIEAIAYQKALIPLMERELAERGLSGAIRVRPIASRSSKASRIDAWISMLRNKMYRLSRRQAGPILHQLNTYVVNSKTCHDDRIDCCAMITMAAQSYRHLMHRSVGDPRIMAAEAASTISAADAWRDIAGAGKSQGWDDTMRSGRPVLDLGSFSDASRGMLQK